MEGKEIMSVLNKDEFFERLRTKIGEDTSEDSLKFIEDVTDTYNEMFTRADGQENWKTKYEENDIEWRNKYKERFFTTPDDVVDNQRKNVIADGEKRTFEQLFKEREG